MKKWMMIIALFLTCQSFAAYTQLPPKEAEATLIRLQKILFQHFQNHRYANCLMPTIDAMGAVYRIDGDLHSTDFFFQAPNRTTIENRVFVDADFLKYIVSQGVGLHRNELLISLDSSENVIGLILSVNSGSASRLDVPCSGH